mgnify:CR=1 FL=1
MTTVYDRLVTAKCPGCGGKGTYADLPGQQTTHGDCHGTGLRWSSLSIACPKETGCYTEHAMAGLLGETDEERNEKPPCCNGTGRVSLPEAERTGTLMDLLPRGWEVRHDSNDEWSVHCALPFYYTWYNHDLDEALAEAIEKEIP